MSLPGLIEHDPFGFDGVSHERIKVMSTEHDVDGAIELAFKFVVDGLRAKPSGREVSTRRSTFEASSASPRAKLPKSVTLTSS